MILKVKVFAKSGRQQIIEGDTWKIYLKNAAKDGKANRELVEVLAQHFGVGKQNVIIVRGTVSRNKTIDIKE